MPPFALHPLAVHVSFPPMNHRIINRYLIREIGSIFLLGLAIFTMVLLMGRMVKLLEMVVSNGVPLWDVARLIIYLLPSFLVLTIPMALLLAVLLAFGRLSADNEITVLKACGVSLADLLPPVLIFATMATAGALYISVVAVPWGNVRFKEFSLQVARNTSESLMQERVFRDDVPGIIMYVDTIDRTRGSLQGVMIHDARDPQRPITIFAHKGVIDSGNSETVLTMLLHDGTIHTTGSTLEYRHVRFDQYLLTAKLNTGNAVLNRAERDMTAAQLLAGSSDMTLPPVRRLKMASELQVRFAFPFATLVFAVIAIPLGVQNRRSGKGGGFTMSIIVLLVYYVIMSFLRTLAEKGSLPPLIALWLPNILFLGIGLLLLYRAAQEKQLPRPLWFLGGR